MKTKHLLTRSLLLLGLLSTINHQLSTAHAQGTAFTYQGRLNVAGTPANGLYDFRFRLAEDNQGMNYAGSPCLANAIPVTNGLFATTLDFGAGLLTGTNYWLEVDVRTNNPGNTLGYTELIPLQALTPTPYAVFATTASNVSGTVSAAQIAGTVLNSSLPASPGFTGTVSANYFAGNGGELTNLNAASLAGSGTLSNLTLNGNLYLPAMTASVGTIYANGSPLISEGPAGARQPNFFAGLNAGNNLAASGSPNVGIGYDALLGLTSGSDNVACGPWSLADNTTGNYNTAVGVTAMENNISGSFNTASGYGALVEPFGGVNNTGSYNTAEGYNTLSGNSTGSYNTANGAGTLSGNSTGSENAANGAYALGSNTGGNYNTANGYQTLENNKTGSYNAANGAYALWNVTVNSGNTADGAYSLYNATGGTNTALGYYAGYNLASGGNNIVIGNPGLATDTNIIRLGSGQAQAFIAGLITGNGGGLTNLAATNLTGTLPLTAFPTAVVTNNATGINLTGTFTGNGAGLTGVNAATVNGLSTANFWQLGGNTVAAGQFLGSANNQPVELWVNNQRALRLEPSGDTGNGVPNVIGGSPVNFVASGAVGATIGGGGAIKYFNNGMRYTNSVTDDFGTVGGGVGNSASYMATVGGGVYNTACNKFSTVGGGNDNTASGWIDGVATVGGGYFNTASGDYSTVGGGDGNIASGNGAFIGGGGWDGFNAFGNLAAGNAAVIGGGLSNTVASHYSTIGGGGNNIIQTNSDHSTIVGGLNNAIDSDSGYAFIGGGQGNQIFFYCNGSTIAGGQENTVMSLNLFDPSATPVTNAFIAGGFRNWVNGNNSFAAGKDAIAMYDDSFVWGDGSSDVNSPATNSVTFLASGGYWFFTDPAQDAGAKLLPNATSWTAICDRNAKKNFQPVDTMAVLAKLAAIPIQQWNYKWEKDTDVPNLGPMAQDFKAAFYPGRDDKGISTLEFDGVELAAIQGLNEKVESGNRKAETEIDELKAENAELKTRLERLEKLLNQTSR